MFEICVKVTVMLGTSVRVEPTAGPPHPSPPTQTTDFVTRVDTVSQGPACNRSVPRERSETPQVIISLSQITLLILQHFVKFLLKTDMKKVILNLK